MISRSTIEKSFNGIINYINTGYGNYIIKTENVIHFFNSEIQVLFGFHSLNLSIVDNSCVNSLDFYPVQINEEDIVINFGSTIEIHNDEKVKKEFDTLFIEGSELFQMSTVHDMDIQDLDIVMYKFLELLVTLRDSKIRHNTKYIQEAIENVTKAHIQYSNA